VSLFGTIRNLFRRPTSAVAAPAPGDWASHLGKSPDNNLALMARQYGAYAGSFAAALKPDEDIDPWGLDSMAVNLIAPVVDTIVNLTISQGVSLTASDDPRQAFLDQVWKANKIDSILYASALNGEIAGDTYLYIDRNDDPRFATIRVLDPRDVSVKVDRATLKPLVYYVAGESEEKEKVIKTRQVIAAHEGQWLIADQVSYDDGKNYSTVSQTLWPFAWAPIQHCQGNPNPSDFHGQGIRLDALKLNDDANFVLSNVKRTLRLHTHPTHVISGVVTPKKPDGTEDRRFRLRLQPGKFLSLGGSVGGGPAPSVSTLTSQLHVTEAMAFADKISAKIHDLYGLPDAAQMENLGQVTGTALKVRYSRAVARVQAKQQLLGDLLERVSACVLELGGYGPDQEVVATWPDPTPQNDLEKVQTASALVGSGIMSKRTAAAEFGLDWDDEQTYLAEERAAAQNIGADLLAAFDQGRQEA
jgi:Phage portal protein, SPP1 Gp6-like.